MSSEWSEEDLRRHESEQETSEPLEQLALRVLTDRVVELSAALGHCQAMAQVLQDARWQNAKEPMLEQIIGLCRSVLWTASSSGDSAGDEW